MRSVSDASHDTARPAALPGRSGRPELDARRWAAAEQVGHCRHPWTPAPHPLCRVPGSRTGADRADRRGRGGRECGDRSTGLHLGGRSPGHRESRLGGRRRDSDPARRPAGRDPRGGRSTLSQGRTSRGHRSGGCAWVVRRSSHRAQEVKHAAPCDFRSALRRRDAGRLRQQLRARPSRPKPPAARRSAWSRRPRGGQILFEVKVETASGRQEVEVRASDGGVVEIEPDHGD